MLFYLLRNKYIYSDLQNIETVFWATVIRSPICYIIGDPFDPVNPIRVRIWFA
jgi:hypothetical protein